MITVPFRVALTAVLALGAAGVARAGTASSGTLVFRSADLRIYRSVSLDGTPVLVLTNLDEAGDVLVPREDPIERASGASCATPAETPPARETAADPAPVTAEAAPAPTIVINVNVTTPPPVEPAYAPIVAPYVVFPVGGRYPDHQPFLGYGTSNASPVWFGGLGMSSTDRYGRVWGATAPADPSGFRAHH